MMNSLLMPSRMESMTHSVSLRYSFGHRFYDLLECMGLYLASLPIENRVGVAKSIDDIYVESDNLYGDSDGSDDSHIVSDSNTLGHLKEMIMLILRDMNSNCKKVFDSLSCYLCQEHSNRIQWIFVFLFTNGLDKDERAASISCSLVINT